MSSAMHRNGSDCRECMFFGACAVALVVASPFLALALFTLRPVFLVLALIALVLIVSPLVIVPRMRGRWQADIAPESAYRGLRLARDVGVHPGHSWAWIGDEEVVVGVDDLAQAELGPIEEVSLPRQGSRVHQGEPLFTIRHGARIIEIPAPVSGTVLRCNDRLLASPSLINQRPFSLGWVARLRADEDLAAAKKHLFFGARAWGWFRAEVDGLLRSVATPGAPADTESLAEHLYAAIDDETWGRLRVGEAVPAVVRPQTVSDALPA
ncbi:MAG: glycine cleavage system protein H [Phycisphaerales bacterium]|nr:glycine cleavage system protein H [Phycisphaerales bacterium]